MLPSHPHAQLIWRFVKGPRLTSGRDTLSSEMSHLRCASLLCRYGLSADVYSFGITIIEVALGHTPYMDMSFRQIVTKKAANAGQPMLAVNTHGKQFSQVRGT